jgi:hypothetical protein
MRSRTEEPATPASSACPWRLAWPESRA